MKKLLLLNILLVVMLCLHAQTDTTERVIDTINFFGKDHNVYVNPVESYNPERGFFQKAFTDKGDPRFMIADSKDNFRFGVGGAAHITAFYDFLGIMADNTFTTWNIPVPTAKQSGHFGIGIGGTKVNFKAVGNIGKHDLVAFIEMGFGTADYIPRLRHAYVSFNGITIGHTYSLFMDLAAGAKTVDLEGPNTQIAMAHPLIAYTQPIGENWTIAVSAEMPSLKIDTSIYYKETYQKVPDFAMHVVWKNKLGHLQLAGLMRTFFYQGKAGQSPSSDDIFPHRFGYGVAFSGNVILTKKCFISFQTVYGKGIAQYIQDLSSSNIDLVKLHNPVVIGGDYSDLRPVPMFGGYLAFQYDWNPHLTSSLVYGHTHLLQAYTKQFDCDFHYTHYAALNLFWNINPYCTIGAEGLYGMRANVDFDNNTKPKGHAARFDIMFMYTF